MLVWKYTYTSRVIVHRKVSSVYASEKAAVISAICCVAAVLTYLVYCVVRVRRAGSIEESVQWRIELGLTIGLVTSMAMIGAGLYLLAAFGLL